MTAAGFFMGRTQREASEKSGVPGTARKIREMVSFQAAETLRLVFFDGTHYGEVVLRRMVCAKRLL